MINIAPTKTNKYLIINFRPLFLDSLNQNIKNIKLATDPKIKPILLIANVISHQKNNNYQKYIQKELIIARKVLRIILPIYQYNGWPDHIYKENNYLSHEYFGSHFYRIVMIIDNMASKIDKYGKTYNNT